jgi:hypothetical protein
MATPTMLARLAVAFPKKAAWAHSADAAKVCVLSVCCLCAVYLLSICCLSVCLLLGTLRRRRQDLCV